MRGDYTERRRLGQKAAMPRPRYDFAPARRRRSPLGMILILLSILILGLLVYLGMADQEVPTERIEQDVTNDILAG
jgi:hypothetical protein